MSKQIGSMIIGLNKQPDHQNHILKGDHEDDYLGSNEAKA